MSYPQVDFTPSLPPLPNDETIQPFGPWARLKERLRTWWRPDIRAMTLEEAALLREVKDLKESLAVLEAEKAKVQSLLELRELTIEGQAKIIVMHHSYLEAVGAVAASTAELAKR